MAETEADRGRGRPIAGEDRGKVPDRGSLSVLIIRPTVEIRLRRYEGAAGCITADWRPI